MNAEWDPLTPQQLASAKAAARLIEQENMGFMMLLFSREKTGAIIANIEPADAVKLIENALIAAKSTLEVTEIPPDRMN